MLPVTSSLAYNLTTQTPSYPQQYELKAHNCQKVQPYKTVQSFCRLHVEAKRFYIFL